jgi:hypothetical protein
MIGVKRKEHPKVNAKLRGGKGRGGGGGFVNMYKGNTVYRERGKDKRGGGKKEGKKCQQQFLCHLSGWSGQAINKWPGTLA